MPLEIPCLEEWFSTLYLSQLSACEPEDISISLKIIYERENGIETERHVVYILYCFIVRVTVL